jgi:hypothetical protein
MDSKATGAADTAPIDLTTFDPTQMDVNVVMDQATLLGTEFGIKIITAAAIFIIGRWIVGAMQSPS